MKFKIKSPKETTSLEIFLNKNTNLLSYKDINNIIKTLESTNQNNSTEIIEFLIFSGGDPFLFYRTGNVVGGHAEWGNTIDGTNLLIQFNDIAMQWEVFIDGSIQGYIPDSNPSDYPIGGNWGFGVYIDISVFNGTLQNVLEQLAASAVKPLYSDAIVHTNETSGLTGLDVPYLSVREAIDELAGYITVVDVSAAQILDMHNTPIDLLYALPSTQYYNIHSAIFEISAGAAYNIPSEDSVVTGFGNLNIYDFAVTNAGVIKMNPASLYNNTSEAVIEASSITLGSGFYMTGSTGDAWTDGTKTVRVIIRYSIRTFGE